MSYNLRSKGPIVPSPEEYLDSLLEEIHKLVEEYNAIRKKMEGETKRLIVEKHCYGCRCTTCWYKYRSDRDSSPAPHTIYDDIYNSIPHFYKD